MNSGQFNAVRGMRLTCDSYRIDGRKLIAGIRIPKLPAGIVRGTEGPRVVTLCTRRFPRFLAPIAVDLVAVATELD
jgi:hypothetical protein